jgi:thiosulfate dehydrogenase
MRARALLAALAAAHAATSAAACSMRNENPAAHAAAGSFTEAAWKPLTDVDIPADSMGASIRRGLALLRFTPESLPKYATSSLRCTSCHQNDGLKATSAPLTGSHARYPKYMPRTGAVVTLADRVNYCFTRSLSGNALPHGSREMEDILAYLAFISNGVPVGTKIAGHDGLQSMKDTLTGDPNRGEMLFGQTCVTCHLNEGTGNGPIPALWGSTSYSIGASMARQERAASFIWHNMPQSKPGTLTPQDAFDLAAYINQHPRPDSPGKENDYPLGGAPKDTPYTTKGHVAFLSPATLVPRKTPGGAVVTAPAKLER